VRLLLADHLHWDGAHHLLVGSLLERLRMATPPEGEAALAKAVAPPPRHQPALGRGQARPPAPAAVTHTAGRSGGSRSRLRPSPRRSKAANSSVKP
jgi:hypothetical protein